MTETSFPFLAANTLQAGENLQTRIAARFAQQIQAQLLAAGSRLPSVRACARQHRVSPQTVVAAYDLLQARGLVEARPKRGFFVRATQQALRQSALSAAAAPLPTHATALMRGMFAQMHAAGSPGLRGMPGSGTLPADWLHTPALAQAVRRVLREGELENVSLHYGDPQGDPALRNALAQQLAQMDIRARPEQLLTCLGATQALDLIARAFTRPGDAVLVEQPGWSAQFAQLDQCGLDPLPVPRGADGPDLDRVAHWARTRRPKLMVVVSRLHNPTGHGLSAANAHRLLQLAREHGFLIVEDDVYGPLSEQPSPLLTAMDALDHTLFISGFSKLLAPGWRVGYVAASRERIARLTDQKLLSNLTSPALTERSLAMLLQQGVLRRQAQQLRERLGVARKQAVRQALAQGCRFEAPAQGMFGWVDTGVDADRLAQRLLDRGYLLAPGRLFDPQAEPSSRMRLNFAHALDVAFWKAYASAVTELRA
ncbi:MAG: PLP-dependent aminotransferase family protein [Burkholderiales bacterium]|nr:PLP-dependent aminotransferase family protein [Burkholderiales bacterium]